MDTKIDYSVDCNGYAIPFNVNPGSIITIMPQDGELTDTMKQVLSAVVNRYSEKNDVVVFEEIENHVVPPHIALVLALSHNGKTPRTVVCTDLMAAVDNYIETHNQLDLRDTDSRDDLCRKFFRVIRYAGIIGYIGIRGAVRTGPVSEGNIAETITTVAMDPICLLTEVDQHVTKTKEEEESCALRDAAVDQLAQDDDSEEEEDEIAFEEGEYLCFAVHTPFPLEYSNRPAVCVAHVIEDISVHTLEGIVEERCDEVGSSDAIGICKILARRGYIHHVQPVMTTIGEIFNDDEYCGAVIGSVNSRPDPRDYKAITIPHGSFIFVDGVPTAMALKDTDIETLVQINTSGDVVKWCPVSDTTGLDCVVSIVDGEHLIQAYLYPSKS